MLSRLITRVDGFLLGIATRRHRLIGLAITRIIIGFATILYCLADYGRREFLWGPHSYDSPQLARAAIPQGGFSLFLISDSDWWFQLLFHLCIVVALAFMIFGGRPLTIAQAVMMWSLHNRNQDILEGGDNLAQILIIFMIFTVTNGYFAPGAKKRRGRLLAETRPRAGVVVHNVAAYLVVFQTCVLYFAAGYWKMFGKLWQDGVAMYYISRERAFDMFPWFAHLMNNPYLGTAICWFTIAIELGFAFSVLSSRPWLRKINVLAVEGMHVGIMVFMGLVCFGLLMIGADCACLRDDDYRRLRRLAVAQWRWAGERVARRRAGPAPDVPLPSPGTPDWEGSRA